MADTQKILVGTQKILVDTQKILVDTIITRWSAPQKIFGRHPKIFGRHHHHQMVNTQKIFGRHPKIFGRHHHHQMVNTQKIFGRHPKIFGRHHHHQMVNTQKILVGTTITRWPTPKKFWSTPPSPDGRHPKNFGLKTQKVGREPKTPKSRPAQKIGKLRYAQCKMAQMHNSSIKTALKRLEHRFYRCPWRVFAS